MDPIAICPTLAIGARVLKITAYVEAMFRLFDLRWMFERTSRSAITNQIDPVLTNAIYPAVHCATTDSGSLSVCMRPV